MVRPGETLLVESGCGTPELARQLGRAGRLTVMTNGLHFARYLADLAQVDVHLTGGRLHHDGQSFQGAQAEASLRACAFDKLFLSVDGFDLKYGMTAIDEARAQLTRCMMTRARKVVVLLESQQLGRNCLHLIGHLDRVHTIIAHDGMVESDRETLSTRGIQLVITKAA